MGCVRVGCGVSVRCGENMRAVDMAVNSYGLFFRYFKHFSSSHSSWCCVNSPARDVVDQDTGMNAI